MDRRLNLSNTGWPMAACWPFCNTAALGVRVHGGLTDGNVAPIAMDDAFDAIKGVTLNVGTADGLLINDNNTDGLPQPIKTVAASGTSTQGGSYTVNSNGSFSYTPTAPAATATWTRSPT